MLNKGWMHDWRWLTIAVGITGGIPTLLMAWTSSPWSCPNNCSLFSEKEIADLKNELKEIAELKLQLMNTMKSVGWMSRASVIRKHLKILKKQHKIRGDRGRPAKNPPMVKLVSLGFLFLWKCLNDLPSRGWMLI